MIMNIESFNISKNVLYKLINKINPVRFRAIAGGLALLSILALPGCSLLEPEKMPPKPANPTGVSGKHDPQAEQLFAKAHVLWKGETCTDPEKALEYLDEALKIEPDYPQALIRRGLALSQLGYADDAFDDLTKAGWLSSVNESLPFFAVTFVGSLDTFTTNVVFLSFLYPV